MLCIYLAHNELGNLKSDGELLTIEYKPTMPMSLATVIVNVF